MTVEAAKVLVVEDDVRLRYTLVRTLASAGYEVLEANSGAEALATVRALGVDLVVLDVELPDMSGEAVRVALKTQARERALVVHLSGVATSPATQAEALDAGADGFLTKPVSGRTLLAHVNALLRLRDAERALWAQQQAELAALAKAGPRAVLDEEAFAQVLEARYGELLDRAVERRVLAVADEVATGVHALAEDLVRQGVGPREVVTAHARAVGSRTVGQPLSRAQVAVEEGRLLLVQVLGELCNRYRTRALKREET